MFKQLFSQLAIVVLIMLASCGRTQHPTAADDTQDTSVRPAD